MKKMWTIPMLILLLTACGAQTDWQEEEVVYSNRILSDHVTAEWTLDGSPASEPAKGTLIRLKLTKDGEAPIEEFDINHEKLLHLMVISKDLSYFNHIHPEYKGGGVFEIENEFPAGGEYRLIADFKPTGGDAMTKMEWVMQGGDPAAPAPVVPSESLMQTASGKRVTLSISELAAKVDTTFTFSITDEADGKPVTDLEPYLGAIGHVVVLSEDGETYVHVHAEEGQGSGPDAVFETSFPRSGMYKIWGQFQQNGQVFTVSYVVKVS